MPVPFSVYEFFRFIIPGAYFVSLLFVLLSLVLKVLSSSSFLSYDAIVFFFAALIVSVIVDSRDAIQYSRGWIEEADYFQLQFPSGHLLDRCRKCDRESTCPNRLTNENYVTTWFYFFNEHIPEYVRNIVLTTGYLCRLSFYVHLFSLFFLCVGVLCVPVAYAIHSVSFWTFLYPGVMLLLAEATYLTNNVGTKGDRWHMLAARALNPNRLRIVAGLMLGLLEPQRKTMSVRASPVQVDAKGLWRRWKTYNDVEIRWMELNEPLLADKVCKAMKAQSAAS